MTNYISGIILCFFIALPAWFLGKAFPIIGSPVFGILIGMILTLLVPTLTTGRFSTGIKYTSKKILQYAVILLGFEMNLFTILEVGRQSLFVMFFTLTAAFLTAYLMGRALKIKSNTTILIGVGTAICGGSAIAATAPVIKADDEDVAQAISTIFLFNIVAVFIFPPLGRLLGMTDLGFGMWAGTAINDTSSVVAASSAWSSVAGNDTALAFATVVKLTRTLMIVPVTLVLAIFTAKKNQTNPDGDTFKFSKVFPWFVLGFLTAAVLNTAFAFPENLSHSLVQLGKFCIVMAMAAIGLNTHLKKLIANGIKPILLGLSCWVAVASISILVQNFMHLW